MSSNSIYQEISSLYLAGSTIDQLQKQFHKSFVFIKQALKETNTPLRTPTNFEYDFDTVKSMAEQNYSKKEVVEQLGGSVRVLDAFLKKNNSSWNNIKPLSEIDTKWDQIVECRTVHKMSCIEIVEHLNLRCHSTTILNRLSRSNIPSLTRTEEIIAKKRRNLIRYGTEYTSQLPEIKEQIKTSKKLLPKRPIIHINTSPLENLQPDGFYVYILKRPDTNLPFYVGKGNDDRYMDHIIAAQYDRKDSNQSKIGTIRKYLEKGLLPLVEFIQCDNEDSAFEIEVEEIAKWGRMIDGGILTNITLGGDGHTHGHKAVDQYNLFGEYIQTFSSLLEAARSFGSQRSGPIIDCCKHQRATKTAFGFFWTYHGEKLDLNWCWNKKRPVYQWSLDGELVGRYINCSAAGKETGMIQNIAEIQKSCKSGGSVVCKGYQWTYGQKPNPSNQRQIRKVKCIETQQTFNSCKDAAWWLGATTSNVKTFAHGIRGVADCREKSYKGHSFEWIT